MATFSTAGNPTSLREKSRRNRGQALISHSRHENRGQALISQKGSRKKRKRGQALISQKGSRKARAGGNQAKTRTGTHLTHTSTFRLEASLTTLTLPPVATLGVMTVPRSHLVDPARAGAYHLVNRCVRRGFLCGGPWEHRQLWVQDMVRAHAAIFAIDVLAYAVMANHFHLVVTTHPERCAAWSADEVAQRWAALFPRRNAAGDPMPADAATIVRWVADPAWVAKHRERLGSISWFMKVMKERLARRANREDGCTGSFWQGRFTSVALLGQAAVIACMAYVDLNPIRAKVAETPEASRLTSVHDRIAARQTHRIATGVAHAARPAAPCAEATASKPLPGPEHGLWIAPIAACTPTSDQTRALAPCSLTLDTYLELVDQTGRIVRSGKRGAIPGHLAPILARLDIDADVWIRIMTEGGHFLGSAIGTMVERATEAARRGVKWLVDRLGLHRPAAPAT
jgi:REP element-mobilizing transposase RayT